MKWKIKFDTYERLLINALFPFVFSIALHRTIAVSFDLAISDRYIGIEQVIAIKTEFLQFEKRK